VCQGVTALRRVTNTAHVAIYAIGVWPIRFDRDGHKALFLNESLGNLGALAIKLVRPVGCLAKENKAGIANERQQWIVVCGPTRERICQGVVPCVEMSL
jgi:hypothetical protein